MSLVGRGMYLVFKIFDFVIEWVLMTGLGY